MVDKPPSKASRKAKPKRKKKPERRCSAGTILKPPVNIPLDTLYEVSRRANPDTDPSNCSRPSTRHTNIEEQTGPPVPVPEHLETVEVFHLIPLILKDVTVRSIGSSSGLVTWTRAEFSYRGSMDPPRLIFGTDECFWRIGDSALSWG